MNKELNQQALDYPAPGDYWQEMFCPYFLVVRVNGDEITVLSCMNRKHELNAYKSVDNNHWTFDLDKEMIVDREWIKNAVKYDTFDGFVADVVRSPKFIQLANEWRIHKAAKLRKEWEDLTGWTILSSK